MKKIKNLQNQKEDIKNQRTTFEKYTSYSNNKLFKEKQTELESNFKELKRHFEIKAMPILNQLGSISGSGIHLPSLVGVDTFRTNDQLPF